MVTQMDYHGFTRSKIHVALVNEYQKTRTCTSSEFGFCTSDIELNDDDSDVKNVPDKTQADIALAQSKDPVICLIMSWILEGCTPSKDKMLAYDPEIRCLMSRRSSLKIKDDILLKTLTSLAEVCAPM